MRISPLFAVFVVISLLTLTVCVALIGILISENSKEISASQELDASEMTGAFSMTNTAPTQAAAPAIQETQPAPAPAVQETQPTVSVTRGSAGSSGSSSSTSGSSTTSQPTAPPESYTPPAQNNDPPADPVPPIAECLEEYTLNAHTIIFYYSNEPHSDAMKTIVQNLQASYTFYWRSTLWDEYFNRCFGTTGATPAFVCAGTRQALVGEVSAAVLEDFAGDCA